MDLKRSADLTLFNEYDLYCSHREGYCQEMEHHLTLLQILLQAVGPWQLQPCLWARSDMGCPRLGLALGGQGPPSCTWASLGHVQAGPYPAPGSSCIKKRETSS